MNEECIDKARDDKKIHLIGYPRGLSMKEIGIEIDLIPMGIRVEPHSLNKVGVGDKVPAYEDLLSLHLCEVSKTNNKHKFYNLQ